MPKYQGNKAKVLKKLNIKDKEGEWVQIIILEGKDKGMRKPVTLEELK